MWGTVRVLPRLCFVLEVAAPGLLVVKHQRGDVLGKFVNVAVLEGEEVAHQVAVPQQRIERSEDADAIVEAWLLLHELR